MTSVADLAAALYGSPAAPPAAPPAPVAPATDTPQPDPIQVQAEAQRSLADLYRDRPLPAAESLAEHDAEFEAWRRSPERLFHDAAGELVPADIFDALTEVDGVPFTPEARDAATAEIRSIAADLALSTSDLSIIKSALGTDIPPLAEADALARLRQEHGDQAATALTAAQRIARANPRLRNVLNATGLGDSPEVVALLARRGMSLVSRGKLSLQGATQ